MHTLGACGKYVLAGLAALASLGTAHAGVTVLYAFAGGNDGDGPWGGLIEDKAGNLYGVTWLGGGGGCSVNPGCGTVFKLAPDGTETVLYSFAGGSDGRQPGGPLIEDAAGNLYGTTNEGGVGTGCENFGCGTVFKLAPDGTKTVLYSFAGGSDAKYPDGVIQDKAGNFYGATGYGGGAGCGGEGCGTVFKLAPDGTETVLYTFAGGSDGYFPGGLIRDKAGNFYGATEFGGLKTAGCDNGCGTVFELAPDGTETVLYAFAGGSDGEFPNGALTKDNAGNLYGATGYGGGTRCGGSGCGTVFKLAPDGTETVLYSFSGSDGNGPSGGLIHDKAGNLYGTTYEGGGGCFVGCGTIFKLAPDGTETMLHAFSGGRDGNSPEGLLKGTDGRLYGTASGGGKYGYGTVFRLRK